MHEYMWNNDFLSNKKYTIIKELPVFTVMLLLYSAADYLTLCLFDYYPAGGGILEFGWYHLGCGSIS
jgi:hypothetical protein